MVSGASGVEIRVLINGEEVELKHAAVVGDYGGDQLVVLLNGTDSTEELVQMAESLCAAVAKVVEDRQKLQQELN